MTGSLGMAPGLLCPPPSVGATGTPPTTHPVATPAPSAPALPLGQPPPAVSFLPPPVVFSLPLVSPLPPPLTAAPPPARAPLSLVPPVPSSSPPPANVAQQAIIVVRACWYWSVVRAMNMKFFVEVRLWFSSALYTENFPHGPQGLVLRGKYCYVEFHPEHSPLFSDVLRSHVTSFHAFCPNSPLRNINTLQSP